MACTHKQALQTLPRSGRASSKKQHEAKRSRKCVVAYSFPVFQKHLSEHQVSNPAQKDNRK